MMLTYLCMIDGLPWKGHIQRQIESVEQYVSKKWGGPITKLIKPKIYDEHSASAILPGLTLMAQVSSNVSRHSEEDGTWLKLVWFADNADEKPITDLVSEALQHVDWKSEADSFWI